MNKTVLTTAALLFAAGASAQTTLTIASVNNPDMVTMQELSTQFEAQNPDIKLEWLFLDEGTLRSRLTTDVATGSGSFDVVTVGAYETPLWAANDWVVSMDALAEQYPDVAADYDFDDLLPAVTDILTYEDQLYALPFYGESSFTMYNKKLFDEAGLTMPEQPTWEQIREFACQLHDPENGVSGIVLRGKPGWGDNMGPITTVVNTYGGQWFDAEGMPQIDSQAWNEAITFYRDLVNECGAPGVTGISFPEALQLMSTGQAAMWVDATVAAGFLAGTDAGPNMAYALAPVGPVEKGNAWLWSWNLGIPSSSDAQEAAFKFATWATSKEYVNLVAEEKGWAAVPPGTRTSTYENPAYAEAAPFAPLVLQSMENADPNDATAEPQIAPGVQFVQIPEFQGIGNDVGQIVTEILSGGTSVEDGLARAQQLADDAMFDAGYY
jgi:sorbitol/mannitol transport system substrate-binding protein